MRHALVAIMAIIAIATVCIFSSGCKALRGKQFKITDTRTGFSVTVDEDGLTDLQVGGTMLAGTLMIQAEEKPDENTPIDAAEYFNVDTNPGAATNNEANDE